MKKMTKHFKKNLTSIDIDFKMNCFFFNSLFLSRPVEKLAKNNIQILHSNYIQKTCSFIYMKNIKFLNTKNISSNIKLYGYHERLGMFVSSFEINLNLNKNSVQNIIDTKLIIYDCFYETKIFAKIEGKNYVSKFSACRVLRGEKVIFYNICECGSISKHDFFELETQMINQRNSSEIVHYNFNKNLKEIQENFVFKINGKYVFKSKCPFCFFRTNEIKKMFNHLNFFHKNFDFFLREQKECKNIESCFCIKNIKKRNKIQPSNNLIIKVVQKNQIQGRNLIIPENFCKRSRITTEKYIFKNEKNIENTKYKYKKINNFVDNFGTFDDLIMAKDDFNFLLYRDSLKLKEIMDIPLDIITAMAKWNDCFRKEISEDFKSSVLRFLNEERESENIISVFYQKGLLNEKEITDLLKKGGFLNKKILFKKIFTKKDITF